MMTLFNTEAMKLGLQGVTLVAASGDDGANSGYGNGYCFYDPKFPASSPYVTAVGATQVRNLPSIQR
jgi:tripeptidyl-peptidase-1